MDPSPPETPRREVVETIHGERIVDPYRWLEADPDDDPEVAAWTDRQNAFADAVLDLPAVETLRERFEDVARVTDHGPIEPAGDRYFQQVRAPDEEQAVLYSREDPDGEGTVVVDPNELGDDGVISVDWFEPGPDGDLVAYGVAEGGREQYDIRVADAATGEVVDELPDAGRGAGNGGLAWTDDGFYYCRTGSLDEGGQLDKAVRFHALGTDPDDDPLVLEDLDEVTWPGLETDGDVLVVHLFQGWETSEVHALRADPTVDPAVGGDSADGDDTADGTDSADGDDTADDFDLTPVLTGHDALFVPTVDDGTLYLLTDHEAPRKRVLAVDVETALDGDLDPADLATVVPESEAVLHDVAVAGDRLLVHAHRDARSELTVHARDGEPLGRVDLPEFATVSGVNGEDGDPVAYLKVESFTEPPRVCRVDLGGIGETEQLAGLETLFAQEGGVDADATVSQERFTSADGTDVPAFVVRRSDVDLDGRTPTVLTGYGGFQVNRTPTYDRFRTPFIEAGGAFVLATLRGGTEYGADWHRAGRREHKQNVFDDAIAVAEGVCELGLTSPEHLAIEGGSNGGLLVGALLTQRPDLWAAAVCRVPLLDMLRFHEFLLGASWTSEYGSPQDPEAFEYLRAYSPYHNVEATDYPPTLFRTAAGDSRVHPGHARKMAALMQERQTGAAPVALRVQDEAGHGVGKPTSMVAEEQAEVWGFLAHHTGLDLDEVAAGDAGVSHKTRPPED